MRFVTNLYCCEVSPGGLPMVTSSFIRRSCVPHTAAIMAIAQPKFLELVAGEICHGPQESSVVRCLSLTAFSNSDPEQTRLPFVSRFVRE
jgi:hypothetical protein